LADTINTSPSPVAIATTGPLKPTPSGRANFPCRSMSYGNMSISFPSSSTARTRMCGKDAFTSCIRFRMYWRSLRIVDTRLQTPEASCRSICAVSSDSLSEGEA
jgi:hypothetical protein